MISLSISRSAQSIVRLPFQVRRISAELALSATFVALLTIAALFPQLFTPYDPLSNDVLAALKPPDGKHLFGTDRLGRDILSRTLYGARYSLLVGLGGALVAVFFGVILGILAGGKNKLVDEGLSRLLDIISAFPTILFTMLVVVFIGQGLATLAFAVGIAGVPKFGRVVRAQMQLVRQADYVSHAVILGKGAFFVFWRHILPNVLVAVPVTAMIYIGTTILAVSGLSFLGLGPQPPTPEWGVMLAEGRDVIRIAWWPSVFPGAAITLTVIAFVAIGNDLQRRFERRTP
ncbi:peptide ABC transporter permease [Alphaproteobacteria bacterium]|nr:peptide ABC transporter permease [Alphaproteobacteria bacterium]